MQRSRGKDTHSGTPTNDPRSYQGVIDSEATSNDSITHLQLTIGNQTVQKLMHSVTNESNRAGVQAKLELSQPEDPYEREADKIAEQVMNMPSSLSDSLSGESTISGEMESKINRKSVMQTVTRSYSSTRGSAARDIGLLKGSGSSLDPHIGRFMESRFGYDFRGIRIHTDEDAARSAEAINARAFASGQDIIFSPGYYDPRTLSGQRLLAHELTHVIYHDNAGVILRQINTDATHMSLSPASAVVLSDEELSQQIFAVRQSIQYGIDGPEMDALRTNLQILQSEQARRFIMRPGLQVQTSSAQSIEQRLSNFKQRVLSEGIIRLRQNQKNLAQWRDLVENVFSDPELVRQTYAQLSSDLYRTATETGGIPAYHRWAGTRNPYLREVLQGQVEGRYRACTGCHLEVQAGVRGQSEPHIGLAWQAPVERLQEMAKPSYGMLSTSTNVNAPTLSPTSQGQSSLALDIMSGRSTQMVLEAIQRIRPVFEPLGPYGYDVLPQEVLNVFGNASPQELRAVILEKIDGRISDYGKLQNAIADGDVEYLDLVPILHDLLSTAEPDIRRAVQDEIDWRETKAWLTFGVVLIATLLSFVFPPLGLALAAYQIYSGHTQFQMGRNYMRGRGANDVFTREQQMSGDEMMAMGIFNMGMGAAAFLGSALPVADWSATQLAIRGDLQLAKTLAARAGTISEAELMQLARSGLVRRISHGYLDWRGYRILYRGQGAPSSELLSPLAQQGGLEASQEMYNTLRSLGLSDADIAGYTAKFNFEPVPHGFTQPPMQPNQPLGGVGIPTTRLPNVAATFAKGESGIIYILRVPKNIPVEVGPYGWGQQSVVEFEHVIFHQIASGDIVRVISPTNIPPLRAVFVDGKWSLAPPAP